MYTFEQLLQVMKRSSRTLRISMYLSLGVSMIICLSCSAPSSDAPTHEQITPIITETAKQDTLLLNAKIEATLESPTAVDVAFSVDGKLEKGEIVLEKGSSFKKGQLLYQINNREAFALLNRTKAEFATSLVELLPEIETDFPTEKNKWVRFLEDLKPQNLLPSFPIFKSPNERNLLTEKGCLIAYLKLQKMEVNMVNYFYIAPFDGTVISLYRQPENHVQHGKTIARIAKKEPFQIRTKIESSLLTVFQQKKPLVYSIQGDTIGEATYKTHTKLSELGLDKMAYFTLKLYRKRPLFHDMKVQLVIPNAQSIVVYRVPTTALNNNEIQLLKGKKLVSYPITIIKTEGGSTWITGLKSGEEFAKTFQQKVPQNKIYQSR